MATSESDGNRLVSTTSY